MWFEFVHNTMLLCSSAIITCGQRHAAVITAHYEYFILYKHQHSNVLLENLNLFVAAITDIDCSIL